MARQSPVFAGVDDKVRRLEDRIEGSENNEDDKDPVEGLGGCSVPDAMCGRIWFIVCSAAVTEIVRSRDWRECVQEKIERGMRTKAGLRDATVPAKANEKADGGAGDSRVWHEAATR